MGDVGTRSRFSYKIMALSLLSLILATTNSRANLPNDFLYYGYYGDRLISQSGKINRDITLLQMKQRAQTNPWVIVGGDAILIARYPKLENKPLYLFDQLSAELQNLRTNVMINFSEYGFAQFNYQVNSDLLLDGFVTLGNLDRSPLFLTVGKQYIPYGDFNKYEAEVNPLNKTIFRIDKPAVTAGIFTGDYLLRASFVDNDEYNNNAVAFSAEKRFKIKQDHWRISAGYISNITDMTRPLRTLDISHNQVSAFDTFAIYNHKQYSLRVEITQALKNFTYTHNLGAYNIDGQYQTTLFNRRTKFSLAVSGLYNQGQIKNDPAFDKLGLFTHQFVLSIKHRLHPQVSLGFSALLGKQRTYQQQAILDLVIKV